MIPDDLKLILTFKKLKKTADNRYRTRARRTRISPGRTSLRIDVRVRQTQHEIAFKFYSSMIELNHMMNF